MAIANEIIASSIEAGGMIIAATITLIGLMVSTKRVLSNQRLKRQLLVAYQDLRVMQEVESVHVQMEIGRGEKENKQMVRDVVFREKGLRVSGNNSPAQVEQKLSRLNTIED